MQHQMHTMYFLHYVDLAPIYSSCKEIFDLNVSRESGEYTIKTVTGRILDKVGESTVSIQGGPKK